MNIGLLGNKLGITQLFNKNGNLYPVTIIQAGPCYITQIKTFENLEYNKIQLGYNNLNFKKQNLMPLSYTSYKFLKEYKVLKTLNVYIGQKFSLDTFKIGQKLNIRSKIIGKGFLGNIKKNHFKRGPMSHGSKHHRLQGSLGAGTSPGRVFPGKKMAGRKKIKTATIKNLEIMDLNLLDNIIFIKGSIPGVIGSLVNIELASSFLLN